MKDDNLKKIEQFCQISFGNEFTKAYKDVHISGKPEILMYSDNFFKKWLYTNIYERISLTPFDILEGLQNENNCSMYVPNFRLNNYNVYKGSFFRLDKISLEDPPIVKDMEALVTAVITDGVFMDNYLPDKNTFKKYAGMFSISDRIYVGYLLDLALEMGLVKKLPAIHINKYVSEAKANIWQDKRKMLEAMTASAIRICCKNLRPIFGYSEGINENTVRNWLTEFKNVDDIMAYLYDLIEIDIRELWLYEDDELDEFDNMILSGNFYTGIILDKWFLTPFSRYFHFIKLEYTIENNIEEHIAFAVEEYNREGSMDPSFGLFSPCTSYDLTLLGRKFFSVGEKHQSEILSRIKSPDLLDMLMYDELKLLRFIRDNKLYIKNDVYLFEIYFSEEKRPICRIDFDSNMTLHLLHCVLSRNVSVARDRFLYSFFIGEISPFTEYTRDGVNKNTMDTKLSDIELEEGDVITYCIKLEEEKDCRAKVEIKLVLKEKSSS